MKSFRSALTRSKSVDMVATPPADDTLRELLLQLWITSKITFAGRLQTMWRAQALLEKDALDEPTRLAALDAAHMLAGTLGTFGLPVGTNLARAIELVMDQASLPGTVDARALAVTLEQLSHIIDQKNAEIPSP